MHGFAMSPAWLVHADSRSPWPQAHVVVAGIGVSGFAAADGLLHFGARVTILDDRLDDLTSDRGKLLEVLGGFVRLGPGSTANLPDDADLVIATGWPASSPLLLQAVARGVPIWSEVELAWRLSRPDKIVPWLGSHRYQRQDHDHTDAGVDPGSRRAENGCGGQHRPPHHGDRAGPGTVRRTRRRALQSPVALVHFAGHALGCGPQRAT